MGRRLVLVLPVALMAVACGKSRALPNGGEGTGGTGRGGAPAVAGSGGVTGAGGVVGSGGSAGATSGTPGTAGSGAGTAGASASGSAGASASGSAGASGTAGAAAGIGGGARGGGGAIGAAGAGAAGRGGAGGTAGTAGTGGSSGTTGMDGGADAARACTTGDTRCDASGHRLRCAADGTWIDDNYLCTMALSGSSDYNTMCALKGDGSLACWASGDWANGQAAMMAARAPAGSLRQISVGDGSFGMCAIATSGALSCWDMQGAVPTGFPAASAGMLDSISYSIYGSCALTTAGSPTCNNMLTLPSDFTGRFKQIVTANSLVYGIDQNDVLHVPSFVQPSYPQAKYKQIIANNNVSCAIRADGAIFCDPVSGMLPPPADADFVEVAATYGNRNACAIRTDGTVTCWVGVPAAPTLGPTPGGTFMHLAGCDNAMCGIRTDGTTVCWQAPDAEPLVPPTGW